MVAAKDCLETGLALHGHKCPAMPIGLRVGAAAMNALGVERARDGQLLALVEIGSRISVRRDSRKLKQGFGWFLVAVAATMLFRAL